MGKDYDCVIVNNLQAEQIAESQAVKQRNAQAFEHIGMDQIKKEEEKKGDAEKAKEAKKRVENVMKEYDCAYGNGAFSALIEKKMQDINLENGGEIDPPKSGDKIASGTFVVHDGPYDISYEFGKSHLVKTNKKALMKTVEVGLDKKERTVKATARCMDLASQSEFEAGLLEVLRLYFKNEMNASDEYDKKLSKERIRFLSFVKSGVGFLVGHGASWTIVFNDDGNDYKLSGVSLYQQ